MNSLKLSLVALSLLAPLLSAPCSADEWKNVKVGVMLCLSGPCQEVGTNALNGIRLASDELNQMGGILNRPVEIVVQDTREMLSPANAVSAYKQLRLDPLIKLFIGPTWSVGGLPLAPIIAKEPEVIAMSPTLGVEAFNEAGDNIFNVWPHDSVSTKSLAKYAVDHGWKRAAVLSALEPWGATQAAIFREEYKRLGGTETVFIEVNTTETNLRPYALKIKNSSPDVIFTTNYNQLDLVGKAFAEIKSPTQLMTILLENTVVKNAAGTLNGILYAAYDPATPAFFRNYQKKYSVEPGIGSDTGYDALMVLAHGVVNAAELDVGKIRSALVRMRHDGASGEIRFDSKGGVIKTPHIMKLSGEERVRAPE